MDEILTFWFGEGAWTLDRLKQRTQLWFRPNPDLDGEVRARFGAQVEAARRGEHDDWAKTAKGRLALLVLLDQFPRNMFRGKPDAFASDDKARIIAEEGIRLGHDAELSAPERLVFYLPLMHTESLEAQQAASAAYHRLAKEAPEELRPELENACRACDRHKEIVERFGRFPHRNGTLGRTPSDAEVAFLKEPNSSF